MRCGTGHPETRSPSLGSTRLRSVPGHRPSLRPTRSWPWPLQPIPVSPLAGRPLTRLRARFKSNVSAPAPTSRCRSATVTDRERSTSTFRTSSPPSSACAFRCGRGANRTGSRMPRARIRRVPRLGCATRSSSSLARSLKPPPECRRYSSASRSSWTACCPTRGERSNRYCGAVTSGAPVNRTEAGRLGITFARAAERPVRFSVRAVGILKYAEPNLVYVNARIGGWVERLYADYVGKRVEQGDPLLALYSPDLVSAQEEYLLARRLNDDTLAASARRRLALWDIPSDQIDSLETRGSVTRTLLLRAPRSGAVTEKMVIEGQAVKAGDNLFQIADARVLWVDVAIFEQDASAVRVGTPATITVDALPGRTFRGSVTFIYPQLDEKTRTLTARVAVENGDGALRTGMYATAALATAGRRSVSVPLEAVLPSGTKALVFVNRGDGRFVPREVRVGLRGDALVEIVQGLKPGDEVVASATFLLDSESNLAAAIQGLMLQMGMGLNMGGMEMGKGEGGRGKRP